MLNKKDVQKNLKNIEESLKLRKFPKSIILEVTSACNFSCVMCHNNSMTREKKNIKNELWDIVLGEIALEDKSTELWLTFYGEAMIFFERVLYGLKKANSLGLKKVFLNTNGSLMDGDKFQQLAKNGLYKLIYSVDAFSKEKYESIRLGGDRDKVYNNILETIAINKNLDEPIIIEVQLIKMQDNLDEIDSFVKFWNSQGVSVKVKSYLNWTEFNGDYNKVVQDYNRIACPWIFNTFPILANGDVVICGCDYDGKKIYGNVYEQSVKSIWESKFTDLQYHLDHKFNLIPEACKKCTDWFVEPSYLVDNEH